MCTLAWVPRRQCPWRLVNPNWHELWKQGKCLSLAPPRSIFYKTKWAWYGVKLTLIDVNVHILRSLDIFDENSGDKIWSKKDKGIKVSPSVPNRVKEGFLYLRFFHALLYSCSPHTVLHCMQASLREIAKGRKVFSAPLASISKVYTIDRYR